MNCNGKRYPMLSNCNFNLTVFGEHDKARIDVQAEYLKDVKEWRIKEMMMKSTSSEQPSKIY